MPTEGGRPGLERGRSDSYAMTAALIAVAVAIVGMVIVGGVALFRLPEDSKDAAAAIGSIIGGAGTAIGTIVGAFVGNHFGSAGRDTAEQLRIEEARRASAELVRTQVLAGMLEPADAEKAMDIANERLTRMGLLGEPRENE